MLKQNEFEWNTNLHRLLPLSIRSHNVNRNEPKAHLQKRETSKKESDYISSGFKQQKKYPH